MKIQLSSIMVDDQQKALRFYTEKLGFVEKHNIPMGEFSWITLVSPEAPDGVELVLEPNNNPAALAFTSALRKQGTPLTAFLVDDVHAEYARLKKLGVAFRAEPKAMGPVTAAVLDDTCGNYIQIYSHNAPEGGGAAAD
ncbi:MAG TPA: VOC family protein [Longimicrobium sp.]|jgi:catechol 2,3-dioxygenase-like lactoylglutathione lyase family enzyme|uniref:VOC family protein n=1 Tax=Longimicrobium sp. TaxID=2029185 RepID=UPI002ED98389